MSFSNAFVTFADEEVKQNALKLREKYGDIVSTRIFSNVYVILNSYDAIKAVYVDHGDSVAGRPQFNFGTRLDDSSSPGLVNAEGPVSLTPHKTAWNYNYLIMPHNNYFRCGKSTDALCCLRYAILALVRRLPSR